MEWKPRLIEPDEIRTVCDVVSNAFSMAPRIPETRFRSMELAGELDRTFAVDDGPVLVGTGSTYSLALSVPGGSLPMAGVTWISVLPTHRRQGILRAVMDTLLDQAIERGEPLSGLAVSEGSIYRRFGYGVATHYRTVTVDTTQTEMLVEPARRGRVRLLSANEAEQLMPELWELQRCRTPGEVTRTPGMWRAFAIDAEAERRGATGRFTAVHEDADGRPDGFVTYRFKHGAAPNGEDNEVRVEWMAGADYRVEVALVRFLLDQDLTRQFCWPTAPVDLPLPWQMANPRAVRTTDLRDQLWLRLLDVPACLSGRRYEADGGVVIDVIDVARPELGGRFMLDAGPDGAECTRTTADADATVAAPDLASLYLGTVSWRTLHLAGLVSEHVPGAIARLDNLFRPDRAPHCATDF